MKNDLRMMKVAAIREERDNLGAALAGARQLLPSLLPAKLPKQVVIKPNLCDITAWETGVTTDPQWLDVVARELRAIRPDVEIRLVESDAVSAYKAYRSCDETFERLGYVAAAEQAGIELINLSRCDTIELRLKCVPQPIRIPEMFLEEMFFISIANLKVHPYTRMTGILKNSLGLLSDADISNLHPHLSVLISQLHRLAPPDLCVIDGRIGLEGRGPILGEPVRMNTVLFGNDALTVDEAACRLMGIETKEVSHLCQTASDFGRTLGEFEIVGEFRPRTFAFQTKRSHRNILIKFGTRRMYQAMETFTTRWIDRGFLFREQPVTFAKSAFRKIARGRREQ